ncbi:MULTISPECIES: ABC transporter permease [Mameliella]|uniref:Monosaccharide-transporting ATPase n=1 Tax=Mameliella alba TaxID=561184 RepID=A0A0B3SHS2_9RHOB|nr:MULTISPECIES: ABC transporter permease [Mameliella]KHQ50124.1 Monosaccharide-transporting ATPase [Mameliella alba]
MMAGLQETYAANSAEAAVLARVRKVNPRILLLVCLVLLVGTGLALTVPHFLSASSLTNILRQWSVLLIVALGATFVIAAGEIDLSVGSVVALVSVLTAWASKGDFAIPLILLAALAVGLAVGTVNALLTLLFRLPSFLATLGMLLIVKGVAMTISLQPMAVRDLDFIRFFRLKPLGLPIPFVIAAALAAVAWIAFHKTRFGNWTRAVGSHAESARLAGVAVARHKALVLVVGAMAAAIGGVILAGRTNYGIAQTAGGMELDVIAAVVLGGGRLGGGTGNVLGTALGALLLTMIFTGIAVLGLPGPWQDITKGALIGVAILLMRR